MWGIDGTFDLNLMPKGEQFATTDHCGYIETYASTYAYGKVTDSTKHKPMTDDRCKNLRYAYISYCNFSDIRCVLNPVNSNEISLAVVVVAAVAVALLQALSISFT
jgi:hypothetical protein